MRRVTQEVTDPQIIASVLDKAQVCRLGLSLGDQPYVVPVSFGFAGEKLYIHGGSAGRKIDTLRANPRVCFEMELEDSLALLKKGDQPCQWGYQYLSVIGFGTARILESDAERRSALDVIVAHYGGPTGVYPDSSLARVTVVEVQVDSLTCKSNS